MSVPFVFGIVVLSIICGLVIKLYRHFMVFSQNIAQLKALFNIESDNLPSNLDLKIITESSVAVDSAYTTFIAPDENKGYDFIVSTLPKYYTTPLHFHIRSNEFVYILEGRISITTNGVETILGPEQYQYITSKHSHILTAIETSKIIVIAKPPLSSRIMSTIKRWFA